VLDRPPRALTVARVHAIEISVNWRWVPVMFLGTWLLAQNVLPAHFPGWQLSTSWLTSAAAVVAGEVALLLHELGHALVARRRGHQVKRIIFHGFHAQTVVEDSLPAPEADALIALVGPGLNLALAGVAEALRLGAATDGALDAFLVMCVIGNLAAAAMNLLPVGGSDGARALAAVRSSGCRSARE
jgi:Zn-dependent protease